MQNTTTAALVGACIAVLGASFAIGCDDGSCTGEVGAAARCGGTTLPGFVAVDARAENPLYTARSRQLIKAKPGVEVRIDEDEYGKPTVMHLKLGNNSGELRCSCPAGCGAMGSTGIVFDSPCHLVRNGDGVWDGCGGDCHSSDSCCMGCGFWTPGG
jgi:hypothetical protein